MRNLIRPSTAALAVLALSLLTAACGRHAEKAANPSAPPPADTAAAKPRNLTLDPAQRHHAPALYRALRRAEDLVAGGERSVPAVESAMAGIVAATPGAKLDYARVLDAETLDPLTTLDRAALAALAVYFGTTRLIDNTFLRP